MTTKSDLLYTPTEEAMLHILQAAAPSIVERSVLVKCCYQPTDKSKKQKIVFAASNVVDAHIKNLRKKLLKGRIEMVRGLGYRYVV